MASSWLDSWGNSWGDAWGQQATDPNALRGTIAGSASAAATMSAVAWLSGSSAGSSTAQAYLELDAPDQAPVIVAAGGPVRRFDYPMPPRQDTGRTRAQRQAAALLVGILH